jgi:hypothetical protein
MNARHCSLMLPVHHDGNLGARASSDGQLRVTGTEAQDGELQ